MRNMLDPDDRVFAFQAGNQLDQRGDLLVGQTAGDLVEQEEFRV